MDTFYRVDTSLSSRCQATGRPERGRGDRRCFVYHPSGRLSLRLIVLQQSPMPVACRFRWRVHPGYCSRWAPLWLLSGRIRPLWQAHCPLTTSRSSRVNRSIDYIGELASQSVVTAVGSGCFSTSSLLKVVCHLPLASLAWWSSSCSRSWACSWR